MNSTLLENMRIAQKQNEVTNADGSFGFSLTNFTEDLFRLTKSDLLALGLDEIATAKIIEYFA